MRILILEDDDRIAKLLAEDVKHQHHVVDVAKDGLQAAEYELIILGLILPNLRWYSSL